MEIDSSVEKRGPRLKAPNVSKVPIFSPFRYPGGKSRLYPFMVKWLSSRLQKPEIMVEPFAGGAHFGLGAVVENRVGELLLVEKDGDVATVWETIVNGECQWLINEIESFEPTREEVENTIRRKHESTRAYAFAVLLKNRVSRGGVTAAGAGLLRNGENEKGIGSRWYAQTLKKRIEKLMSVRDRIGFEHGDGFEQLINYADEPSAVFFIDPPYPKAGKRLYSYPDVEPKKVFEHCADLEGEFLLTYSKTDEILALVDQFEFDYKTVEMSTSHHRTKEELLISSELGWLKSDLDMFSE